MVFWSYNSGHVQEAYNHEDAQPETRNANDSADQVVRNPFTKRENSVWFIGDWVNRKSTAELFSKSFCIILSYVVVPEYV